MANALQFHIFLASVLSLLSSGSGGSRREASAVGVVGVTQRVRSPRRIW